MSLSPLDQMQTLSHGMDIIILVLSSPHEELYWQKRLNNVRGQIIKDHTRIITICEDWEGGAGNALGTLYAFSKANALMQEKFNFSLLDQLERGLSIALYHTAGKGTRLAPLTACEYNSKSRIKLVGQVKNKTAPIPITLLEAILKQTSIFAPHRRGRLSVFWGDQIFIPEKEIQPVDHAVDLLVQTLPEDPSEEEWNQKHYEKYGLVLVNEKKQFKQLEKLFYQQFTHLSRASDEKVGLSLGCFSLSKEILIAFLEEFSTELTSKKGKMDTDPHFWMPLSLDFETYLSISKKRNFPIENVKAHYQRMLHFKEKFLKKSKKNLLGASNIGENSTWWDFGNTVSYHKNSLKLVEQSDEGAKMRSFFATPSQPQNHIDNTNLDIQNSCLINCSIRKGKIINSVLINVVADEVSLSNSVLTETSAQKIDAKDAILYNVAENGSLLVENHTIRADNFSKDYGHIKLHNSIQSPISWDECSEKNTFSFSQLHQLNQGFHPSEGQLRAQSAHNQVKQAVLNLQIQEKE
ncbi:MAG: hypothetical protein S4CHLAM7_15010 [Chlamydiae bacterium]|nr:hypothetical protein [Chlamydiota bacterium]